MSMQRCVLLTACLAAVVVAAAPAAADCFDDCAAMAALCAESQTQGCAGQACAEAVIVCGDMRSSCERKCAGETVPQEAAAGPTQPTAPQVDAAPPFPPAGRSPILDNVADLDRDWRAVRETVRGEGFSRQTKRDALDEFFAKHPYENKYSQEARALLRGLESGDVGRDDLRAAEDEARGKSPGFYRKKTEWLAFDLGVGSIGASARLTAFTLRWEHFYWNAVRGAFSAGWGGYGGHGGTGIGVPFHLGDEGRKELRVGAGVEFGGFRFSDAFAGTGCTDHEDEWCGPGCGQWEVTYAGPIPFLEILYSRHLRPRIGFEIGATLYLFLPQFVDKDLPYNYQNPEGEFVFCVDSVDGGAWVTPDVFLFFGFTV